MIKEGEVLCFQRWRQMEREGDEQVSEAGEVGEGLGNWVEDRVCVEVDFFE